MKYFALKNPLKVTRTPMGLVGQYKTKVPADPKKLRDANYAPLTEDKLLKAWFPALKKDDKKVIVVITAHDDDLIAFSGSIAKLAKERNAEVHHLILTDGSMGCGEEFMRMVCPAKELARLTKALVVDKCPKKDPGYHVIGNTKALNEYAEVLRKAGQKMAEVRETEARDAEKILGWQHTYFLGFQDTALEQHNFGITPYYNIGAMAVGLRLVRDINPDLIILQDRNQTVDFNPDHYASGRIGYAIYHHLHCPVLGVDGMEKPFKALIHRGFEGIGRPEFRFCDYLVELDDTYLGIKRDSLFAYKSQIELVEGLFTVSEMESKFRIEGFFDVEAAPARLY